MHSSLVNHLRQIWRASSAVSKKGLTQNPAVVNSSCCGMRVTRGSTKLSQLAAADAVRSPDAAVAASSPAAVAATASSLDVANTGAIALASPSAGTPAAELPTVDARNILQPAAAATADAEAMNSGQQLVSSRRRRKAVRPDTVRSGRKHANNATSRRTTAAETEPAATAPYTQTTSKRRRGAPTSTAAAADLSQPSSQTTATADSAQAQALTASHAVTAAAACTACVADGIPLLDLGDILVGELIKRPSATVKTPYVADVKLPDGTVVLAHTPSLDCAGMIVPGSRVYMTANAAKGGGQQTTKTSHTVQLAEDPREDGQSALVGAHPYLAEKVADAAVQQHLLPLPQHLQGYTHILKQQTEGQGRFDFVLCYENGSRLLLEVKNAVCADFPAGKVPAARGKAGVYTSTAEPHVRTALFPIGSSKRPIGVVSDRAIKHLHELNLLQQAGQDSEGRAVHCAVLFIVNRGDCAAFRPCHEADMMFARMLQRAQESGVLVMAHDVCWQGSKAVWGKQLPVVYIAGVDCADIDEEHLNEVLKFNATDPRTRWKKAKQKPQ